MSGITSIGPRIYGAFTKSGFNKNVYNAFVKNPAKSIANATIASIVAKDGIGCAFYVYQSYNNKKIPEKRRKFVTALDATNGILMIGTQIAAAVAMRKINEKAFSKIFNRIFDKNGKALKMYVEQIRADQKAENLTPVKKFLLNQGYDGIKKQAFDTFSFFTELVAATIFAKRILVPFMATPLANKLEKWMDKHSAKNGGSVEDAKAQEQAEPSMKGNHADVKQAQEAEVQTAQDANTNLIEKYKQAHNA